MEFHKENITDEWWDLVNEFPEFILNISPQVESYTNHVGDVNKSDLLNLRYGFECGVGWKEILREYFTDIRSLIKEAESNNHDLKYSTCIMKEKFGELRDQGGIYGEDYKLYQEKYYKLVGELQRKSSKVCEECGKEGMLLRKKGGWGWLKTLCESHALELNYH